MVSITSKEVTDVGFKLKKPCKDCPFLKTASFHAGIFSSLMQYHEHLESRTLVHTCHKTDNRADSDEGKAYKGKPQHCAGVLLMMKKDASLMGAYQTKAFIKRQWRPEDMTGEDKVFDSMIEMVRHYCSLSGDKRAMEAAEQCELRESGAI